MKTPVTETICAVVLLLLISLTASAANTNSVWDLKVPFISVTNMPEAELFRKIEEISVQLDPAKKGIHVIYPTPCKSQEVPAPPPIPTMTDRTGVIGLPPEAPAETGRRISWTLSNVPLRQLATYLSVNSRTVFFIQNYVLLLDVQTEAELTLGTAGVYGKCLDARTDQPVTNAIFRACSTLLQQLDPPLGAHSLVAADGTFVLALPYWDHKAYLCSGCESPCVEFPLEPENGRVAYEVSAPGYLSQTNTMSVLSRARTFPESIKLTKVPSLPAAER